MEGVDKYAYIPMTAWLCDTPMEIATIHKREKVPSILSKRNWKMVMLSSIGSLPTTARGEFMDEHDHMEKDKEICSK